MSENTLSEAAASVRQIDGFEAFQPSSDPRAQGLMKQYFSEPTRAYGAQYGDLADNVYKAQCQGLDPENFFAWTTVLLRSANTEFTGYSNARPDDTQRVYILKPATVKYIPNGALMKYGSNTWLVLRTRNLATPRGSAIIRRCNTVGRRAKPYEVMTGIPLVIDTQEITSANPTIGSVDSLMSGQLKVYCQRNSETETWEENTRLVLGTSVFIIRGIDDFTREFTDDEDSNKVLSFTLQRTSPLPGEV